MTSKRWLITAATTLLVLFVSTHGPAQVLEVRVVIEGMSCPFCAFGVEKKLGAVKGVAEVGVEMKEGRANLTAADGLSIDTPAVPDAVRKAGFTPGEIEITARGTLLKEGDGVAIRLPESQQALVLHPIPKPRVDEAQRLADNMTLVEVKGVWRADENGGQTIEATSIREISE